MMTRPDDWNPPAIVAPAEGLGELAALANAGYEAGEDATRKGIDHYIASGEALVKAKKLCGHGKWLPWVEKNLRFGDRQARKLMRLYRERDRLKSESDSDLTIDGAARRSPAATRTKTGPWNRRRCGRATFTSARERMPPAARPSARSPLVPTRPTTGSRPSHSSGASMSITAAGGCVWMGRRGWRNSRRSTASFPGQTVGRNPPTTRVCRRWPSNLTCWTAGNARAGTTGTRTCPLRGEKRPSRWR